MSKFTKVTQCIHRTHYMRSFVLSLSKDALVNPTDYHVLLRHSPVGSRHKKRRP